MHTAQIHLQGAAATVGFFSHVLKMLASRALLPQLDDPSGSDVRMRLRLSMEDLHQVRHGNEPSQWLDVGGAQQLVVNHEPQWK